MLKNLILLRLGLYLAPVLVVTRRVVLLLLVVALTSSRQTVLAQECGADGVCDTHERCPVWKGEGHCTKNAAYMREVLIGSFPSVLFSFVVRQTSHDHVLSASALPLLLCKSSRQKVVKSNSRRRRLG